MGCTDVSYVAGEGVELTVRKESVVIEERNLFMTEIIIELGYSHAFIHVADFR